MLHSTAQHSTAQHSTAQHSTAQHSTAQHSTAQQFSALNRSFLRSKIQFFSSKAQLFRDSFVSVLFFADIFCNFFHIFNISSLVVIQMKEISLCLRVRNKILLDENIAFRKEKF
jgi:hypothetical protein